MAKGVGLQIYEVRSFLRSTNQTGTGSEEFFLISGARILVTLQIESIDPGAQVKIDLYNSIDIDSPYILTGSLELNQVGSLQRVFSDFNPLCRLTYTVTGGVATFKVGVAVFDNASTTRIENAQLSVDLDHVSDVLGHFDSVRIGDGTYQLKINPDGSITVIPQDAPDELVVNPYNEVAAVPPAVETLIVSYTVPPAKTAYMQRAECSGENIARYKIYVNGDAVATKRTYFGSDMNANFDFTGPLKNSFPLAAGDIVTVKVLHNRPDGADFEARLQLVEKG